MTDEELRTTLLAFDALKRQQEVKDGPASTQRAWITAVAAITAATAALFGTLGTMLGVLLGKHL
jgi:hypothetical protein